MSTRLTKALEFANYRITINNQQAQLKAKTQNLLSYSINGGTFSIDVSLITFCKQLIDDGQTEVVPALPGALGSSPPVIVGRRS